MPVIVRAATIALTIASSTASTVASNMPSSWSFGTNDTCCRPRSAFAAPGLAVEKARKMSPEPLPAVPPVREMPIAERAAMRLSCVGNSGASVATTTMIEPSSLAGP